MTSFQKPLSLSRNPSYLALKSTDEVPITTKKKRGLFIPQVIALVTKNIIYSFWHLPISFLQIFIPSLLVISFYIINTYFMMSSTIVDDLNVVEISGENSKFVFYYAAVNQSHEERYRNLFAKMAEIGGYSIGYDIFTLKDMDECETQFCRYALNEFGGEASEYEEYSVFAETFINNCSVNISGFVMVYESESDNDLMSYFIYQNSEVLFKNPYETEKNFNYHNQDQSLAIQRLFYKAIYELNFEGEEIVFDMQKISFVNPDLPFDDKDIVLHCLLVISILLCTVFVHFKINDERNRELKHGLLLNNVSSFAYMVSWFVTESILYTISCLSLLIIGGWCDYSIFVNVDIYILFTVFMLFGITGVSTWMCCSTCIKGAVCTTITTMSYVMLSTAITFGALASSMSFDYIFTFVPVSYVFPSVQLAKLISDFNIVISDKGEFKFGDIFKKASPIQVSFVPLIVLAATCISLLFLTFYADQVLPSTDKVPRSWLFLFKAKFWGLGPKDVNLAIDAVVHDQSKGGSVIPDLDPDIYNEYQKTIAAVKNKNIPLKILKISKTYTNAFQKSRNKVALSEVTLMCQRGEVLVILGHNGAGKTTLVNIITGTTYSTYGDIIINNNSVSQDLATIKSNIGVCPQFNVIWPDLTVKQHFYFFAMMKGISLFKVGKRIDDLLDNLGLNHVANQHASKCSGGEKRRVTFGLSILADPPVLVLDEPSSGLDPIRKRKLWNYLGQIKKNKVIILTTHSMEEADVCGDKIAFLALSRLRAIGDTTHLKNRFGFGYNISILFQEQECIEEVKQKINDISSNLLLNSEVNLLLTYAMPFTLSESVKSKLFNLVEDLQSQKKIQNFQLSHTTIEEVFMNVTHGNMNLINISADEKNSEKKLNVMIEGEQSCKCGVKCGDLDTLKDMRGLISKEIGTSEFKFLEDEVEIEESDEKERIAKTFLPLVTIRVFDESMKKSDNIFELRKLVEQQTKLIEEQRLEIQKFKQLYEEERKKNK